MSGSVPCGSSPEVIGQLPQVAAFHAQRGRLSPARAPQPSAGRLDGTVLRTLRLQDSAVLAGSAESLRGAADGAGEQGPGSLKVGFHAPAEGVLLQDGPGDGFVDVPQLADREPCAQKALGIGAVGIPPP